MPDGGDLRQFVFRMAEANRPEKKRLIRFRETLDTTILGTLSMSLGVVVLLLGLLSLIGIGRIEWHEQFRGRPVPSTTFGVVAIIGEVLGVAGLTLGQLRGRTIPPLCALGTIICLVQMYAFFGQFIFLSLS